MGKFPRKVEGYQCPDCEEVHDTEEDAQNCCPRDVEKVFLWECVECGEKHEDREDAYNCCG